MLRGSGASFATFTMASARAAPLCGQQASSRAGTAGLSALLHDFSDLMRAAATKMACALLHKMALGSLQSEAKKPLQALQPGCTSKRE